MGSHNGSVINITTNIPDLTLTALGETSAAKPSPDRYRRPAQKRADSNNVTLKTVPAASSPDASSTTVNVAPTLPRTESMDDSAIGTAKPNRYRRRSFGNLDVGRAPASLDTMRPSTSDASATSTPTTIRGAFFDNVPTEISQNAATTSQDTVKLVASNQAEPKTANAGSRGSTDLTKRVVTPSPLSREAQVDDSPSSAASPSKPKTYASAAQSGMASASPATQHLAALADKDLNKGMKSRLRRAFSFGSAQELRRGAAENNAIAQQAKEQHQQQIDDELDAEQQEIARRQEEAGIGAGIYSGQGGFAGSTDNLSISSTASSASMMLRKMGRATKKGAKSIRGIFRPKSVVGVPAMDGPAQVGPSAAVQPSVAQVSMVTVEAERQKVNVNAHPSEQPHGVTGFPKLERNSIDAANSIVKPGSRGSADGSDSRRSIVGSDRDRAEVLAAVKKGILKRSGTASPSGGSPVIRPVVDGNSAPVLNLPDSPASSMPSTPKDGRTGSLKGGANGDYFTNRLPSMSKSAVTTPNGSTRSISFSPRIQFHDAWSATEYDRRGEIATCNRLTPMLAQQIKEELNTFKMVRSIGAGIHCGVYTC
jgi:hypothetical protein